MLIDEQFRKSVALLTVDIGSRRTAAGTGALVGIPIGGDYWVNYLVTALHVIHGSRKYGPLNLRLNVRPEHVAPGALGFADIPIALEAWIEHPTTDVAIAQLPGFTEKVDCKVIPHEMIASNEYVATQKVGVGDAVFFAGLFSQHPGQQRFQPIIRFGTISMMPHEKITTQIIQGVNTQVDAYLVEARSWGGHSGSPMFIYYPPDREPGRLQVGATAPALLGIVSGHYRIPNEPEALRDSLDSTQGSANSGIAAVIPAQAILDLLNGDELVEKREKAKEQIKKDGQPAVTPDTGLPGYTRENFLGDLEKATRPLPGGENPDPKKT